MIRRPAVAGTFYPADPGALARTVDDLLDGAAAGEVTVPPKALVVPHAGYRYSGSVAASAYALLRGSDLRRVALAGPAHFVPLRGSAVPQAERWETPLGPVSIDADLQAVATRAGAAARDEPHTPEHALEVQLPFLQRTLGPDLRVLPIAIGIATAAEAADLLERLWDEVDLLVVSTDLSHDLDDVTARRVDRRTAAAVVRRDPVTIPDDAACGVFALRGLAELARRRELAVRLLDLRTSAQTAGDPGRVVGYGAFAIG